MTIYGLPPERIGLFEPEWHEYMHFMYLPVVMPGEDAGDVLVNGHIRLPENLEFMREIVEEICENEQVIDDDGNVRRYVYVTARRGFATPGNPLNRPGWHSDGFGSSDVNYIWSDRWPTRFAVGDFGVISDDHVVSAEQFTKRAESWSPAITVVSGEPKTVYRLTPSVVHATPLIEAPGGERSFFKVSVSPDRYNLLGNSHNYLFDYEWEMWSRAEVRNHPAYAGGDAGPQEALASTEKDRP